MTATASKTSGSAHTKATINITINEDDTVNIETIFDPPVTEDLPEHKAADVAIAMIEGVFGEDVKPSEAGPLGETPQ